MRSDSSSSVTMATFGKLFSCSVDGAVGRGEMVSKKPRPLPAGSFGFELCSEVSAHNLPTPRPLGCW